MKALRKTAEGYGAELVEVDVPTIGRSEILVKVKAAALCRSDVDVVEWTELVRRGKLKLPITLGHEFAGVVVETGPEVKGIKRGDRIAADTHNPCGVCYSCRTGNRHICPNGMGVLGRSMDGCFAEYIKLPEIMAIKLPDNVTFAQGAVMEPLATAMHAVSKAKPWGDSIAILGVGTIGQMAVELSRILGATKIFALGARDVKLAESRARGADVLINGTKEDFVEIVRANTGGVGVGSVVELTGNERVINQAVEILRVAGNFVQVGMVDAPLTLDNFMYGVAYKELNLTGIFGRRMFDTWETLLSILETGKINLDSYVGKEIRLENFMDSLKEFRNVNGRIVIRFED